MNTTQFKCLAVFSIFAVIGFGPISLGCLIGMYVVLKRPPWFWQLTNNLYVEKTPMQSGVTMKEKQLMRKKCFLSLLILFIIDIAPVPVTPVIAFAIILSRPLWFYRVVSTIYG